MDIYPNGDLFLGNNWATAELRLLLIRSTSTYVFNPAHTTLQDFFSNGGVEVSVPSYSRKTLANKVRTLEGSSGYTRYDSDDVQFGNLESGQEVQGGILVARATPGSDSMDDLLITHDNGFGFLKLAANANANATTIWCYPALSAMPSGAAVDFGGGATATLDGDVAKGDTQISITPLAAAANVGDTAVNVRTSRLIPGHDVVAILQNGSFVWEVGADGWILNRAQIA